MSRFVTGLAFACVVEARTTLRRPLETYREDDVVAGLASTDDTTWGREGRMLAGGGGEEDTGNPACHKSGSFLGVGNVDCIHDNVGTAIFLLAVIIIISLLFERVISVVQRVIKCPQLKKIVNRLFEEVMIMGFISMVIFTLNRSGVLQRLHFTFDDDLSDTDRLHFYEFFHYVVFLTMIYFIVIVLLLLFVGTVVPRLIWDIQPDENEFEEDEYEQRYPRTDDEDMDTFGDSDERFSRRSELPSALRARKTSGMDLVQGSRAYELLLQRYQREGWCFRFNLRKQWNLWKSFEILAYNICQYRSGYLYKNPSEMTRLFGVKPRMDNHGEVVPMTYSRFHVLCMRNMLYNISHLHFSAFVILLAITMLPMLYPAYDHWIFLGVGGILLVANIVICIKVLQILRGIVDDRLYVISNREIQRRMVRSIGQTKQDQHRPPSFRVVALAVRAMLRMQMSALCHQQLHYHNHLFWFNSPRFLLRVFHFSTIGQAFYLVWFSLVEWQNVTSTSSRAYLIPIMILFPLLALCVITPLTMPSLVLVLSLTGIFVELNATDDESGHKPSQTDTKTRIRLMRRSFLKSHHTDTDDFVPPCSSPTSKPLAGTSVSSPSSVFLRMYDSPTSVIQHGKNFEVPSPSARRSPSSRDDLQLIAPRSSPSRISGSRTTDSLAGAMRPRRSFDLTSYYSHTDSELITPRTASFDINTSLRSPRPRDQALSATPAMDTSTDSSPAFKSYCSKYGGYPET